VTRKENAFWMHKTTKVRDLTKYKELWHAHEIQYPTISNSAKTSIRSKNNRKTTSKTLVNITGNQSLIALY